MLADDQSTIELGVNSYDGQRWDECVERFHGMLRSDSPTALRDPGAKNRARTYYAACLMALHRDQDADDQMKVIILEDPRFRPNAAIFPSLVMDRFTMMRQQLEPEIKKREQELLMQEELLRIDADNKRKAAAMRLERLRDMASEEVLIHANSRWIGFIPFGVGQFQNRQNALGWTFLTIESLAASASIASFLVNQSIQSRYQQGVTDPQVASDASKKATLVNYISFGTLIGAGIFGVAHAQWTFVPEHREIKRRPLPAELALGVTPTQSGAAISLQGVF